MSESDTESVECPLCGEAFDPTAAGGWCTNSDCGEWQYESDGSPDDHPGADLDSSDGGAETDDEEFDPLAGTDDDSEPADPPGWISGSTGNGTDEGSDAGATDEGGDSDDLAGDLEAAAAELGDTDENGEAESSSDADDEDAASAAEPAPESGSEDAASEPDAADDADEADEQATFDCSGCGTSLSADVNFCPECGEDVSHLPGSDGGDELENCPACDASVDASDNFCVECGEDLDAHRSGTDALTECPDCGTDVDGDDSFCAGCGADLDAHRSGDAGATGGHGGGGAGSGEQAPDSLALTAHGKSVVVGDGDVVGREIRSLLTEAGRPEDEAVRVHREHVRFVRESGGFYVVALGQNPTHVNGKSLAKGDREQVAPGDELELSDVVTLDVEAA